MQDVDIVIKPREVMLEEGFAKDNDLRPGSRFTVRNRREQAVPQEW